MSNEYKEKTIKNKSKEKIINYISTRLGIPFEYFNFKDVDLSTGYIYDELWSLELGKGRLGVFKFGLKTCHLNVKITIRNEGKELYVSTDLSYEHINCGSNGCDLDVSLRYYPESDRLIENPSRTEGDIR